MPEKIYTFGTLTIYIICVLGGLLINDLGVIFECLAGFINTFIAFIWPGSFYLIAYYRYGYKRMVKHNNTLDRVNAYF